MNDHTESKGMNVHLCVKQRRIIIVCVINCNHKKYSYDGARSKSSNSLGKKKKNF